MDHVEQSFSVCIPNPGRDYGDEWEKIDPAYSDFWDRESVQISKRNFVDGHRFITVTVDWSPLEPVHKLVESDESVVIQGGARRVEVPLVDCGEPAAVSA
jgi:hypothetical protein